MNIENLSEEAREVLAAMIEHCMEKGVCMGMDEGFDDDDKKHPFRLELEALAKECKESVEQ